MANTVTYGSEVRLDQGAISSAGPIQVSASRSLTNADDGEVLECTASITLTIPDGLKSSFGCAVIPFGTTNVARAAPVTLNGATSTIARVATPGAMFAITRRGNGSNDYVVTAG